MEQAVEARAATTTTLSLITWERCRMTRSVASGSVFRHTSHHRPWRTRLRASERRRA